MGNLIINRVRTESIPLIRELTMQLWPQTYAALFPQQQIGYMLNMMNSTVALQQQISIGSPFIIAYYDEQPVASAT